jgi:prepilin peptidase CpaA
MSSVLCFLSAAFLVTGWGAWFDVRTGHIPNGLTLGTIAAAPLVHGAAELAGGGGLRSALLSFALSIAGALACALLPAALYARHAIGGGDVKLFAAVGALCHPMLGLRAELYGFALGGLYAIAIVFARRRGQSTFINVLSLLTPGSDASRRMTQSGSMMAVRFGPAIFAGTALSIWVTERGRWLSP